MGWNPFKSEEVTRVATQTSRIIDDAALPNSVKTGSIKSVFYDGSPSDFILDELVESLGTRAERMYRYCEDHYTWGMPSGEVYSSTQGRKEVEDLIELTEGKQVFMEYSHYGTLNALHVGWMKLVQSYGYNAVTNELATLSASKGYQVYLKDMVPVVPSAEMSGTESGRLISWGTAACAGYTPERPYNTGTLSHMVPASPVVVSSVASALQLQVTYVWKTPDRVIHTESVTLSLTGYNLGANFFHARYTVDGMTKFFLYELGTGTHSTLEQVYTAGPAVSGSYFPFIYFRFDKHSTNSDPNSSAYRTSKRACKTLGMDFDVVADAINQNPDIADVEQAMMTFSIPSVTSNKLECRYLFDYFDNQHDVIGGPTQVNEVAIQQALAGAAVSYGSWSEYATATAISDSRFRMVLSNGGIYKRLVAGSIGAINSYTSGYEVVNISQPVVDENGSAGFQDTPLKLHRYRHQLTTGVYEEILVQNLSMTYYIWNGYNTTADENDDIMLVPIDLAISSRYSLADREELYARSLHIIFNSRTTQKIKWYQQEWFSVVLIIVAIVLTVLDMGADGGSWIATALELTGTQAIVATVIFNLIVGSLIMPAVFKLFVKVFGKDFATLVAVAAMVYAAYSLSTNGIKGAPWAKDLLFMSTGLSSAVIQANMSDLLEEYDQLNKYMDEQTKLLDKANELLENQTILSPFVIYGEKPEDFYNRTVHYGNIGTLGINAISSYVELALTLPKVNDTLGEPING